VPDLRPAPERPPVEHEPAADPGPERQHDHVARAAAGAQHPLGERSRVRVVLDRDRQAEATLHPIAKGEVCERDVDRALRAARALVDPRRDADPDGADSVAQHLLDRRVESREQLVLRGRRSRAFAPLGDAPVPFHDAGRDLGAAEVDADHGVSRHGGWLA
jgi:hypothetical protein